MWKKIHAYVSIADETQLQSVFFLICFDNLPKTYEWNIIQMGLLALFEHADRPAYISD
jgi:hypothetical protein